MSDFIGLVVSPLVVRSQFRTDFESFCAIIPDQTPDLFKRFSVVNQIMVAGLVTLKTTSKPLLLLERLQAFLVQHPNLKLFKQPRRFSVDEWQFYLHLATTAETLTAKNFTALDSFVRGGNEIMGIYWQGIMTKGEAIT